jgi:hypothetical protein
LPISLEHGESLAILVLSCGQGFTFLPYRANR